MIIITLILIALMLAVFWLDATRFIIPNWLVSVVIGLYPLYVLINPHKVDWVGASGVAVVAFAIGIGLFAAKVMGGGDVKLLAGCCLWTGMETILDFVIFTTFIGGVLSLLLIVGRPILGYLWLRALENKPIPRVLEKGEPIPYGLAIAGALLILIAQGKIIGLILPL